MRLLDAAEYFNPEWIGISAGRCLTIRHRMESCDVCVRNCPQHAITVSIEDVQIDPALCNNCGLCVHDCPTGVFAHDYHDGFRLIEWARNKPAITLYCQMSGAVELQKDEARLPCLGMLDAPLLASFAAVGVRDVALCGLDACAECPTKVGAERVESLLAGLMPEAAFPSVHPQAEEAEVDAVDVPSPRQADVTESSTNDAGGRHAEPVTDRRGFLKSLGKGGARIAASSSIPRLITQEEKQAVVHNLGVDEEALMIKHVPERHRLALTALFAGQIDASDVDWFHRIEASDACTGCRVCAIRCPTGALQWQDEGDHVHLDYRTAACIGCSLCVSICPYQALTLSSQQSEQAVLNDEIATLFESEQLTCEQCGSRFLPHDGDNRYCWICKNEMEMDSQWMSMLKKPGAG